MSLYPRLRAFVLLGLVLAALSAPPVRAGETLYNGIELPAEWPPRLKEIPKVLPRPPYLVNPPGVIHIDIGRQLFIDDFLIEKTDMTRRYHKPVWHPANPILKPEKPWELAGTDTAGRKGPTAGPFSGGVFYDPADKKFKLWYMAGYLRDIALATSDDGVRWQRPDLGVRHGTNIVIPGGATESNTFWLDVDANDPARRFKYFVFRGGGHGQMRYHHSGDGLSWSPEIWKAGTSFDRTTVFYNPFRKKWVFLVRESSSNMEHGRIKRYWEVSDINDARAVNWGKMEDAPLWVAAEWGKDYPRPELMVGSQLYNLDCVAYESVILGFFSILRGDFDLDRATGLAIDTDRPKACEVMLGFTRDGFHWHRPVHTPFLGMSERKGDWNWGNVQSACGGCLVVGDHLYFYVSGRAGKSMPGCETTFAGTSTGLAVLRRDGFASMTADGSTEKTLTTRKLRTTGRHLFVNVDAPDGELRAEVLDADGQPIPPFTRQNCEAIRADTTLHQVTWKGASDLAMVAGRDLRIRFYLRNGALYSFWLSRYDRGASRGFVGAGGPGFSSHHDTAGIAAYPSNRSPRARATADVTARATDGKSPVLLDATASVDPDGRIASYAWLHEGKPIANSAKASVSLPVGKHAITLAVTDEKGASGYDEVTVQVRPQVDAEPVRESLAVWYRADAIEGLADGAPLVEWRDSSPSRLDLHAKYVDRRKKTEETPAEYERKRPVWRASVANGKPAVTFDGVDDRLYTGYTRGMMFTFSRASMFAVFRALGTVEDRALFGQDHGEFHTRNDGSIGYTGLNASLRGKAGTVKPDIWTMATMVRSGPAAGETALYVNGVRGDNGAASPYYKVNSNEGQVGCGRNEKQFWKGDIAEVLIYSEALTDEQRAAVEGYLKKKYGIK